MAKPIPTSIHIALRGWSWHGPNMQHDELGLPCNPGVTPREHVLLEALERIVLEAMEYSPAQRLDSDSYLPAMFIDKAQIALRAFGMDVQPTNGRPA